MSAFARRMPHFALLCTRGERPRGRRELTLKHLR